MRRAVKGAIRFQKITLYDVHSQAAGNAGIARHLPTRNGVPCTKGVTGLPQHALEGTRQRWCSKGGIITSMTVNIRDQRRHVPVNSEREIREVDYELVEHGTAPLLDILLLGSGRASLGKEQEQ